MERPAWSCTSMPHFSYFWRMIFNQTFHGDWVTFLSAQKRCPITFVLCSSFVSFHTKYNLKFHSRQTHDVCKNDSFVRPLNIGKQNLILPSLCGGSSTHGTTEYKSRPIAVCFRNATGAISHSRFLTVFGALSDIIENVYEHFEKWARLAAGHVSLRALGWSPIRDDAFSQCKRGLQTHVTLVNVHITKRLCVYTDTADFFWSGVVSRFSWRDISLLCVDQHYEPPAFLSRYFSVSSSRCLAIKKEAYAIIATVVRRRWLLASSCGIELKKDQNNVVLLFCSTLIIADPSQIILREVLR